MVFQNYALYPHMSVYDNMAFGLMLRKFPKAEITPPRGERRAHPRHRRRCSTASPRRSPAGSGSAWRWAAPSCATPRCSCSTSRFEPRRQAARADAHRDQEGPPDRPHHHGLRHPRPGGGDDPGRPRGGDERRDHRAGRPAAGALPPPHDPLRRRLHRQPGDELHPGAAGERRRRAAPQPAGRHHPAGAGRAHRAATAAHAGQGAAVRHPAGAPDRGRRISTARTSPPSRRRPR